MILKFDETKLKKNKEIIDKLKFEIEKDFISQIGIQLKSVLEDIGYLEGFYFKVHNQYNDEGYDINISNLYVLIKRNPLKPELLNTIIENIKLTAENKWIISEIDKAKDNKEQLFDCVVNYICSDDYDYDKNNYVINVDKYYLKYITDLIIEKEHIDIILDLEKQIEKLENKISEIFYLGEDESFSINVSKKEIEYCTRDGKKL